MKSQTSSNINIGLAGLAVCWFILLSAPANAVIVLPNAPLGVSTSAKPMTMITAGKDHKLYYEAYNDSSDIDGDGTLDIRFKPSITYFGLYDSTLCYGYSSSDLTGLFSPTATADSLGRCSGANDWSGNWLNYITTSRIDALRKVLYGGYREVDSTTQTILRRAYIPQDAHSWGKEYHNATTDGYKISDYTPLSEPSSNSRRHFFGSLTANRSVNCSTLNDCSNKAPVLRIRTNVGNNTRIWQWASKERPVLDTQISSPVNGSDINFPTDTDAEANYTVRVLVCTATYNRDCKQYPNGQYKPIGLLHDYGENDSMLFGLLTGSYDQHMSGGRLRKVVSSFANEVTVNTGQFVSTAPIVNTFNRLRIRGFNQSSSSSEYWKSNPYEDSAKAATEGQFVDWGNPIAEIMYEATRYFAGTKSPTAAFNVANAIDGQVGLSSVTWDDPYADDSAAKAPSCSRANFLTISDINPSFDSNQIPGSHFNTYTGDLTDLEVKSLGDTITGVESNITGMRFIGQSGTGTGSYDAAPTAKNVDSLGTIRGLSPEEPTKQGSYYSASMAYYAKKTDLRPNFPLNPTSGSRITQNIENYVVALSSPLPRIEAKLPNGKIINVVPFSKSVGGAGISATKGNYQPTNQIVDFYVETIDDPTYNGGRYYAKFIINYEDVEQGGDHDMDAIAEYTIQANANNTLSVTVTPTYQRGGIQQNMGYVISGSNHDGVYLVARDETTSPAYFLNVPNGQFAGYCDVATPSSQTGCGSLPSVGQAANTFIFSSGNSTATLLKDPLWYAAKWGGFVDKNNNGRPDTGADSDPNPNKNFEWDADNNGTPDTYFLVQNPLKLKETLKRTLDNIIERSASAGNVTSNNTAITTDTQVFQSLFNSATWSGNLLAYPVSSAGRGLTPNWQTADQIPDPVARKIFTKTGGVAKEFKWSELSTTDQTALISEDIVNYLRSDRTKELQNSGSFRNRTTNVLGDIVHSSPYYMKDTNTVYVGANDGMLHAFNATNGSELFAYVPSQALSRLKNLSKTDYGSTTNPHDYFVDGDIAVSTLAQTPGHNYLVATLGHGGKGLFGLEVSAPASFGASNVLWEYLDASDTNLGVMLGRPVIAKMNGGTMAVIVGNGYNSTNGKAVLYIFNLATGALLKTIDTLVGGDNGLATPGLFDSDGDGDIDFIYAGDLKGNVWKFDVSGNSSSAWAVALSGSPLFQAMDTSATPQPQPITAQITVAVNDVVGDPNKDKRFIFFGTGSYFRTGDPNDLQVQSWYGLIDENAQITDRTSLKLRTILSAGTVSIPATATELERTIPVRTFSAAVAGDMAGKKGWYFDLTTPNGTPNGTAEGERIVTSSKVYRLAESVLLASSIIPVVDPCVPGGKGYINAISPYTGARLGLGFFDLNKNGNFTDDKLDGVNIGSIDMGVGMPSEPVIIGNRLVVGGSSGGIGEELINLGGGSRRISWREIIQK